MLSHLISKTNFQDKPVFAEEKTESQSGTHQTPPTYALNHPLLLLLPLLSLRTRVWSPWLPCSWAPVLVLQSLTGVTYLFDTFASGERELFSARGFTQTLDKASGCPWESGTFCTLLRLLTATGTWQLVLECPGSSRVQGNEGSIHPTFPVAGNRCLSAPSRLLLFDKPDSNRDFGGPSPSPLPLV